MNETSIAWTDYSSNPLRYRDAAGKTVWACVHASPGCLHCYAEATAKRFHHGVDFTMPNMRGLTPFLDEKELHTLLKAPGLSGKRVFLGDMTDLFGEWVPEGMLDMLLKVICIRDDVTFQLLTKRANRMRGYFQGLQLASLLGPMGPKPRRWPLSNLWLGVSVEDQRRADERGG